MEITIKDSGNLVKCMVEEYLSVQMVLEVKAYGSMGDFCNSQNE